MERRKVRSRAAATGTTPRLKVLTLRQPWAWLFVESEKRVENRRQGWGYRGGFLVHAGLECTVREYDDIAATVRRINPDILIPPRSELVYGALIGWARIVDRLEPTPEPTVEWHLPKQYGYVCEDRTALPAQPMKGRLGLWSLPIDQISKRIAERLPVEWFPGIADGSFLAEGISRND